VRHRKAGFKLSRNHHQRQALFKNLIRSLIISERLNTTTAKAKAIKPLVDKLMTKAKSGTLAARREVSEFLTDKVTVTKLFDDLAVRVKTRTSGFTRIQRSFRRLGDDTQMVKIEFVDAKKVEKK
jgi:large subunit ribosomal protein L17